MLKETQTGGEEVIPGIGGNFSLDTNVIASLPEGTKVLRASSYGASFWTRTARIATELPDGTRRDYFLKCTTEGGAVRMEGDFSSMSAIYDLIPSFAPKPLAWGKYKVADPETYFLLCEFVEMSNGLPDPVQFCAKVAELHRSSVSPTGKFGFHTPTVHGKTEQIVEWESNWTLYFTKLITQFFEKDLVSNGRWPEYEAAFKRLVDHAIPQILDPLQSDGRSIKPSLVHGNLWEGNASTNVVTGEPVVFDAAAMYAHNEYELGIWRREIIRFGKLHFRQYLRHMPPSEPEEQWDDRNALYSLKFKLSYSLHRPGLPLVREQILTDIMYLVNKYPPKIAQDNVNEVVNKRDVSDEVAVRGELTEAVPKLPTEALSEIHEVTANEMATSGGIACKENQSEVVFNLPTEAPSEIGKEAASGGEPSKEVSNLPAEAPSELRKRATSKGEPAKTASKIPMEASEAASHKKRKIWYMQVINYLTPNTWLFRV